MGPSRSIPQMHRRDALTGADTALPSHGSGLLHAALVLLLDLPCIGGDLQNTRVLIHRHQVGDGIGDVGHGTWGG